MLPDLVVLVGLLVILVLTILFDLRQLRLPNGLSLALLVLFPFHAAGLADWTAVGLQAGFAALIFVVLFLAFAFRLLGGGDVKLISALALFVPLGQLPEVMLIFAAMLILGVGLVLAARTLWRGRASEWGVFTSKKLPMGLSIGLAGLGVLWMNAAPFMG